MLCLLRRKRWDGMILKFLKQLFCIPHRYEQELSPFDDEWWEECRRCEKTRKVKKVII